MKAKSKEIKDLLDNEPFLNLKTFHGKVLEYNFSADHNEYTISEAIVDLENLKDIIIKAINDKILDIYSFQSRDNVLNRFIRIRDNINNLIINQQNNVPTLLDEIQGTKEYVLFTLNLDSRVKDLFDYKDQIKKLTLLQEKYNSLITELKRAEGIYKKSKNQIDDIQTNYLEIQTLTEKFSSLKNELDTKNSEFINIISQIHNQFNLVNNQTTKINEFSVNVDIQEKKIIEAKAELDNLIDQNKELESKITDLLSWAVGGSLGKTFGERKEELLKLERFWKYATFISILFLFIASGFVAYELFKGVGETTVFLSKISLLIPASAAVSFTSTNHNRERKLLEEYAFKSSISLSLDSYRKVLNEELSDGEKDKISGFLINSMEKIYSSPLENIYNHSSSDDEIQLSILEKVMKMIK